MAAGCVRSSTRPGPRDRRGRGPAERACDERALVGRRVEGANSGIGDDCERARR